MSNIPAMDSLVILWSTGETEVFHKVIYPYALNSKEQDWWKEVELIIWGPSGKSTLDENLKLEIEHLREAGVKLTACKWCSDQYEISDHLRSFGVDVKFMGSPLTDYIKTGKKVLTF
jgi:hypothetical protein